MDAILRELEIALEAWPRSRTCRVVNATGIILHSGLGRAVLPAAAIAEISTAERYNLLEVAKEDGNRRKRDAFCEDLLCELTGAEAAIVVNNNAAATMIILNTLAKDKDVIVSRSQMVEIGGSFRLPDVMEMSGCKLREVGTTNKSYVYDYERAIHEETGALMLVHTSNYKIIGFVEHVGIEDMVALGKKHDIPVIDDLGSGSLIDLSPWGISDNPPVQASVKAQADVICFSGDKLVGGPQAGIIVGKKAWIERIRSNHMARALRIDKLTCIALESTLKLYLEPETVLQRVPTLGMLTAGVDGLQKKAEVFVKRLKKILPDAAKPEVIESTSQLGAGSLPTFQIPTRCLAVQPVGHSADKIARALRQRPISIFPRIQDDRILFDLRTMRDGDEAIVEQALIEILSEDAS